MKIGILIETKEFEKAWNAFRFAVTAKKQLMAGYILGEFIKSYNRKKYSYS